MSTVSMVNLQKRYANGFEAVPGLDLQINDGEFLVLVGPSGCGKSTVLRMVAGLEDISGGDLLIDDVRVNAMGPQQRDIAMVFQSYALYPNMTVGENIAFAMKLRKTDKAEIKAKVAEVAELLELTPVLDRKPGQLSGGQRQRVAMGRAIVRQPKLFLMDEPLSNLDAKLRVQTRAEISKLQRRLGVTTVYVTHDQVEAMTMGDRVAVLRRGELMQVATPEMLYSDPANLFVAQFIGSPSMNVVRGSVASADPSGITLDIAGQTLRLTGDAAGRLSGLAARVGEDIAVGIRPEALEGDGDASIDVLVDLVEMLGSGKLAHCTIEAPSVRSTDTGVEISERNESTVIASLDPRHTVRAGERVSFTLDTHRLHAFDVTTGAAIGRS
ncbi:MAG: sn-glycerol-3-phosphate ABC transporter ATP-binding protein UgpC [Actinomycetota bacterium]|nr:sn-glycerol-3-phosphate ABC transporter ATP-binding protein UgpC [Actinomycetota bacterium]